MSTAPPATHRRRPHPLFITLVVVAVLMVLVSLAATVWTDFLWYRNLGYERVFTTRLGTRSGLFVAGLVVMAGLVIGNGLVAMKLRPAIRPSAQSSLLENYRQVLFSGRFRTVLIVVGLVLGLFAGVGMSANVDTVLAFVNRTPFAAPEAGFGLNPAFFVFDFPFWKMVLNFLITCLVLSSLVAVVIHYLSGALRLERGARSSIGAQVHLSVLIGVVLLVYAALRIFDRYGLQVSSDQLLTGIGYTDDHVRVTAQLILAAITVLCALLFFANAVMRRWTIPVASVVLLILSSLILGLIYPASVQAFSVNPDEPDKEKPYIERHIAATREAFGVSDVAIEDYKAVTQTSPGQLRADAEALPGIRLIDPNVVAPAYEQFQQVRGFYQFPSKLDVDRYTLNGQESDVVVAAREIDLAGLDSQSWNNIHTVYTHGYGMVAAYGNRRQAEGEPDWIAKDIPPTGLLSEHEPRIYFGQLHTDYSIVGAPAGSPPVELDTPGGGDQSGGSKMFTYNGKGGVPLGNFLDKALYAIRFADPNILLSDRVNQDSRIIYDRTPTQRVKAAAPWLTVDSNIYPAIVSGRLVWIVDGYTTSNTYPNAQRVNLNSAIDARRATDTGLGVTGTSVNYMRNSVKAVVDAYDGTVNLYAWDTSDPIMETWSKAFPGMIKGRDQISRELLDHLRYPEDLFQVQREVLSRYHMTDAHQWYQRTDLWQVPDDPVAGQGNKEQPYYLSVKWPGDAKPTFSLTSVYVPNGRSNLASYMAVNADAASPDYGKIRVLRMSDQTQIDGPGQTFNAMTTNEQVATRLRPYLNEGAAKAAYGNLLTLPVGGGLLYVQPVYTERQGSTGAYPALTFVLARFGQSVGIGSTLQEALDQVFAGDAGATTGENGAPAGATTGGSTSGSKTSTPTTPGAPDQAALQQAVADAEKAFADADAALKAGNLAEYQKKTQDAQAAVERAKAAMGG
ncbi:hypothetical protein GA0111570_105120 [Raineyella antarctica]|uniref:UPF0182 protein GA0111570_105120 n=1 Tax=Raineyella antarctica TaxID=1577474 RepID=A0A1G6GW21_9ACTN|nr:UPF0182 family protein [Raineyella antarctica]SDB85875.1 hypothetical protein GA0111570_105120 [Raineyella antarctica]